MDKQNVPYATELMLRVIHFCENQTGVLPFRLTQIAPGLKFLCLIFRGVLALNAFMSLGVADILEAVSTAARILLRLFRKFGSSFIPTQLYNDLMETSKKTFKRDQPFFVVSLGTENYFNLSRSTHNTGSMDCLEIINRSQWIHAVSDVLVYHPDWKTKHSGPKRLSVTLDHSNIAQWSSNDLKAS